MRYRKTLKWAAAGLSVLLCLALCLSAALLYHSGLARRAEAGPTEPIFTREAARQRLIAISPLAALWLACVITARITRCRGESPRAHQDPENTLRLLRRRKAVGEEARREMRIRRRNRLLCATAIAPCALWALIWIADRSHFTSWDLEAVMGQALLHTLVPAAAGFAAALICQCANDKSRQREIEALKAAQHLDEGNPAATAAKPLPGKARQALRAALLAAAVALIALGIANGGAYDVFVKAVNICTECIGLG